MQLNENKLYSKPLGTLREGSMRFAGVNAAYSILPPVGPAWKAQEVNSAFKGYFSRHSRDTRLQTPVGTRPRFACESSLQHYLETGRTEPACSPHSPFIQFWRRLRESHLIE